MCVFCFEICVLEGREIQISNKAHKHQNYCAQYSSLEVQNLAYFISCINLLVWWNVDSCNIATFSKYTNPCVHCLHCWVYQEGSNLNSNLDYFVGHLVISPVNYPGAI